jgi:hypothetical protein
MHAYYFLEKCEVEDTMRTKRLDKETRSKRLEKRSEIIETRLDSALGWQEVTPTRMLSLNSLLLFLASRIYSNLLFLASRLLLLD